MGICGARSGLAAATDVHALASRFRLLDVHEGYTRGDRGARRYMDHRNIASRYSRL